MRFFKYHKLLPVLCSALFFECGAAQAAELAVSKDDVKEHYSWALLPAMSDVQANVAKTLVEKLKLEPGYAGKVPVGRIFTSEWYQVMVDNKVYVIDQYAKYWLMVDGEVNFFMFENGVQSVNQSNRSRDSLLMFRPLLESMSDYVVVYPSLKPNVRNVVYVFMDIACPFSKAFHLTKRQTLQMEGFEFRYIPFSARRKNKQQGKLQQVVWCASNQDEKHMWLDKIYTSVKPEDTYYSLGASAINEDTCPTAGHRALNIFETVIDNHRLTGTPMFINDNGVIFYGYDAFLRGNLSK